MRRTLIGLAAASTLAISLFGGALPASAAPPGPQCVVAPCNEGPVGTVTYYVEKITKTCQYAYCQQP